MATPETGLQRVEAKLVAYQPPDEIIARASERATALSKVVESRHLFAMIGSKKHLVAEAWQLVSAFEHCNWVEEGEPRPVMNDAGEIIAYSSTVTLVQDGIVVGRATMSCGLEEYPCQRKEGIAKHRAAMSAAQTWAGAKAARMKFAWVVVLAGYEPTPAEEMDSRANVVAGEVVTAGGGSLPEHFCVEHNTARFKKGEMKRWAHPIEGTDPTKWCNEPQAPAKAPAAPPAGKAAPKPTAPLAKLTGEAAKTSFWALVLGDPAQNKANLGYPDNAAVVKALGSQYDDLSDYFEMGGTPAMAYDKLRKLKALSPQAAPPQDEPPPDDESEV